MKHNIKFYIEYFGLPILEYSEEVEESFIQSIRAQHYFIITVIHDQEGNCLFIRDFNKNIGWEFPGGYVGENESPELAAHRIAFDEAGLRIDQLMPICIVKNTFKFNNISIVHEGIAFAALSRDRLKPFSPELNFIYTKICPHHSAYQNEAIFNSAQLYLVNKFYNLAFNEIECVRGNYFRNIFDKKIVKCLSKITSDKIFNKIVRLIKPNPNTILDISCGDSSNIVNLQNVYPNALCVGNDMNWESIKNIKKYNKNVIFTNFDMNYLPFKKKIDVIIFKNTLHHIKETSQLELINNLAVVSNQLIIMDVLDPKQSSLLAKIWNFYYRKFLNDQGNTFLGLNNFHSLIEKSCKNKKIKFGEVSTIKGVYMYSSIEDLK